MVKCSIVAMLKSSLQANRRSVVLIGSHVHVLRGCWGILANEEDQSDKVSKGSVSCYLSRSRILSPVITNVLVPSGPNPGDGLATSLTWILID
jgi:hypothetical protein